MPTKTRDQMFRESFAQFMENMEISNEPDEPRKVYTFDDDNYELFCNTNNKNLGTQEYELVIDKTIQFRYRVSRDASGRRDNSEVITTTQEVPTIDEFIRAFNDYYAPFMETCLPHGRRSYMYVKEEETDEPAYNINIVIMYARGHYPFPSTLSNKDVSNETIKEYTTRIIELKRRSKAKTAAIYHLQQSVDDEYERSVKNYKSMQNKYRELYAKCNEHEDCPVCMEPIEAAKLELPGCGHMICSSCSSRCHRCPICRDTYDEHMTEWHNTHNRTSDQDITA
jgi:hypothetical protein